MTGNAPAAGTKNQKFAYAYGLATVLIWSTVATAFKLALRELDHFQLLLMADVVSCATLGLLLAARGKLRRPPPSREGKSSAIACSAR